MFFEKFYQFSLIMRKMRIIIIFEYSRGGTREVQKRSFGFEHI